MVFGQNKKIGKIKLSIENVELEKVDEIKFLGVILDKNICWKPHINYIRSNLV